MRMIDADYVLSALGIFNDRKNGNEHFLFGIDTAKEIVQNAPTIEAEPVRHGHWIDKPTGKYGNWQSYCSACGKHSQIGGIESNRHKPRCPWCGAFMDEVSE